MPSVEPRTLANRRLMPAAPARVPVFGGEGQPDAGRIRLLLQRALDGRLLHSVFQPIFDLDTGRAVGFEALARFRTEVQRGPVWWFAEAAAAGVLTKLELVALRAAVDRLPDLPVDAYLAINLSPATIVCPELASILARAPTERIVVELTEHVPIADYKVLDAVRAWLRHRGIRLAVDDAGAGFSSLRHIVRLRPELIKVDRSLVRDVQSDLAQRAVVRALISFAREIGATLIAEGIETPAELEALGQLGVRYGQGYYLGVPAAPPASDSDRAARTA